MHILLTDLLTCPRCGPRFGLVLLADEMAGRDIRGGRLGCANCREEYPIAGGAADLSLGSAARRTPPEPRGAEWVERLAALLGVTAGPGSLLLVGAADRDAAALSSLLPGLQVVAAGTGAGEGAVAVGDALPFRDRAFRGVALLEPSAVRLAAEAARVLVSGARLVVDPAPAGTASRLASEALDLLLDQEGVVVASALQPA